jgi:hypothetical protein
MKTVMRTILTVIAAVATYHFVFWLPCSLIFPLDRPSWLPALLSLACAIAVARYTWRYTASDHPGFALSVGVGAVIVGSIGFVGGFFGPLIFAPDANQGPMLGIFITGPLGALVGGVGGGIYWSMKRGTKVGA